MNSERNLAGRMLLVRVQRHIAQVGIMTRSRNNGGRDIPHPDFQFWNRGLEQAFFLVERLLCELEKEFDAAKRAEKEIAR